MGYHSIFHVDALQEGVLFFIDLKSHINGLLLTFAEKLYHVIVLNYSHLGQNVLC